MDSSRAASTVLMTNPRWLAPCVLSGLPGQLAADVWAFGTVRTHTRGGWREGRLHAARGQGCTALHGTTHAACCPNTWLPAAPQPPRRCCGSSWRGSFPLRT